MGNWLTKSCAIIEDYRDSLVSGLGLEIGKNKIFVGCGQDLLGDFNSLE